MHNNETCLNKIKEKIINKNQFLYWVWMVSMRKITQTNHKTKSYYNLHSHLQINYLYQYSVDIILGKTNLRIKNLEKMGYESK